MYIKDMFERKINRDIKGVIKVGQGDDENVRQELEEYVVTKELNRHFADFFSSYKDAVVGKTDKMGVWISGFFGSGKSHFLKILSYLLENKVVDGKTALDYFIEDNKIKDEMILADMKLAANTPADVILFNIDSKSSMADSQNNKEAILSVFLKVFNQHLGFYGANPHLADLERALTEENKYDEFQKAFLDIRGRSWTDSRHQFRFIQDDVCRALVKIGYATIEAAKNICESFTGAYELDINTFAKMVKQHIDLKGNNHHVIFLVDEIGQYIGEKSDLMLNLQTVAEDLGTECAGKAWIIVTSQQDIDSITKVKGNDFSKIQGRFDTRLSLSSADVAEVIKKRILEKTQSAAQNLSLLYEEKDVIIKNLIIFNDGVEKKLYRDSDDFVSVYPFIPYQFNLLGDVLTSIRNHGATGKHLAEGERSMLSLYRESAMAIMDDDEKTLVPFSSFYNALEQFLDHSHRVVISRASENDNLNPNREQYCFDVEVLKTLFMIKYLEGAITANLENITSLMVTNIDQDRVALKGKVEQALTKLCSQNYVQKTGEIFVFLSNEEQEINREIDTQNVETSEVTAKISEIIFDDLYDEKKYRYPEFGGRYTFGFNQIVDDRSFRNNQNFDITLKILTPDYDGGTEDTTLRLMSGQSHSVIVRLPDDRAFIDEIRYRIKIEKYLRKDGNNAAKNHEQIKTAKRNEMRERNTNARIFLQESLKEAIIYTNGDRVQSTSKDIRTRFNDALGKLINTVYYKLSYIDTPMDDTNLRTVLKGKDKGQLTLTGASPLANYLALEDLKDYIFTNTSRHTKTSIKTIRDRFTKAPYGFVDDDISWLVAKLFKDGDISFFVHGEQITLLSKSHDEVLRYITQREFNEKLLTETRQRPPEKQKKIVREVCKELFGVSISEEDDDLIMRSFLSYASDLRSAIEILEIHYKNQPTYPGMMTVKKGKALLLEIMSDQFTTPFFKTVEEKQDALMDFAEDYAPIKAFFAGQQKEIWDKSLNLIDIYENSKTFIADSQIHKAMDNINIIMKRPSPYSQIRQLPELMDRYIELYSQLLETQAKPIFEAIQEARERTIEVLSDKTCRESYSQKVIDSFDGLKKKAETCNNVAVLHNIKIEADTLKVRLINEINDHEAEAVAVMQTTDAPDDLPTPMPATPAKVQKTVSIKTINLETTWRIENEQDIERYVDKLRTELKKAITEDTILNIEF